MKQLYTLLICLLAVATYAQEEETLIKDIEIIGVFGGPILEVGSINGEVGLDLGGGGAILLNNIFIGGYGLGTDYPEVTIDDETYNLRLRHGGLWLGYTSNPYKLMHFYSSARLGWGKTEIRGSGPAIASDRVFVLTPEVGLEVNLTRFMRLAITGGYRLVSGVSKLPGFENGDFSSPVGGITFRFGGFANDWGDLDWDW
ncbi:MAG: hypothetical protein AAF242_06050 [Bacteroidota bacterium]